MKEKWQCVFAFLQYSITFYVNENFEPMLVQCLSCIKLFLFQSLVVPLCDSNWISLNFCILRVISDICTLITMQCNGVCHDGKCAYFRQSSPSSLCVKAGLESSDAKWYLTDCSDVSAKGFVCQRRQNVEDIGKPFFSFPQVSSCTTMMRLGLNCELKFSTNGERFNLSLTFSYSLIFSW